jgi:hypothetical protein
MACVYIGLGLCGIAGLGRFSSVRGLVDRSF